MAQENEWDKKDREVAQSIMKALNGNERGFVSIFYDVLTRDHRTLQAYAIRMMVQILKRIGTEYEYGTDARNDDAIRWCKALVKACETNPELDRHIGSC